MRKNKFKLTALIASSVLAIQASSLLSTSLKPKAMTGILHKIKNTGNNILNARGLVTGCLIGVTVMSATGLGISIGNIVNNSESKDYKKEKPTNNTSSTTSSGSGFEF